MKKISESRLATLLREEVKLMNLEIAGVENWEGYKEALYPSKPNESEAYYADYLNMSDEEIMQLYKEKEVLKNPNMQNIRKKLFKTQ